MVATVGFSQQFACETAGVLLRIHGLVDQVSGGVVDDCLPFQGRELSLFSEAARCYLALMM